MAAPLPTRKLPSFPSSLSSTRSSREATSSWIAKTSSPCTSSQLVSDKSSKYFYNFWLQIDGLKKFSQRYFNSRLCKFSENQKIS